MGVKCNDEKSKEPSVEQIDGFFDENDQKKEHGHG